MKKIFVIAVILVSSLTNAQQKKDTTEVLEFKYRWYLNNVRDSTKVEEDIKKAIEQLKSKPKIKYHNRLCYIYKPQKATQL
jgi:hypothetical protein